MQLTKIISTEVDNIGRRVVKFIRFGLRDTRTAEQIGPYGIDSNPIKDMIAVYANTESKGEPVIIGYLNKNALAAIGEFRVFSTDEGGTVKATIHLKNNGVTQMTGDSWEIGGSAKNLVKFQELETGFNQLKTDFNNLVAAYNAHTHAGVTSGVATTAPPPAPAQSSTASVQNAKVEAIKVA